MPASRTQRGGCVGARRGVGLGVMFGSSVGVGALILLAAMKTLDLHGPVTSSLRFGDDGEQRFGTVSVYGIEQGKWMPVMRAAEW